MTKAQVAREYRAKHPEWPSTKLARVLFNKEKLIFNSVEDARDALRYIEGKKGAKQKKKVGDTAFIKDGHRPVNPYNLPASDETDYKPYVIKGAKKIIILSDIHIPYHSIHALTAAFDYIKKSKPDLILLNGDTLDFHGLSRFCKDPRKRSFASELNSFKELFPILESIAPNARKVFKIGNHEERYMHFLWQKAGELNGVEEFELENIIKARADGIEIVGDKRIIKAGGLNIIHGHEFATSFFSPVNVARGLYLRGKTSAIQGHSHQTSEHTENNMNGKITTTWSTGCLCELHPQYMPINKWNHGFAEVELDGQEFQVKNMRIYNGKIL